MELHGLEEEEEVVVNLIMELMVLENMVELMVIILQVLL